MLTSPRKLQRETDEYLEDDSSLLRSIQEDTEDPNIFA